MILSILTNIDGVSKYPVKNTAQWLDENNQVGHGLLKPIELLCFAEV
jgi:hypothetical protein